MQRLFHCLIDCCVVLTAHGLTRNEESSLEFMLFQIRLDVGFNLRLKGII
jgi:hypothetical protein